jgi:hypothetical protein
MKLDGTLGVDKEGPVRTFLRLGVPRPKDGWLSYILYGKRPLVAYDLLSYGNPPGEADILRFEQIVRDARLSSGIFRTTYRGRFRDLDALVLGLLKANNDQRTKLSVEDWAASDGLTAAEWATGILSSFPLARVTASDKILFLVNARSRLGARYILEPDGAPLQFICPPLVVSLTSDRPALLSFNRVLSVWARSDVSSIQRKLREVHWGQFPDEVTRVVNRWDFRQIPLIHPDVWNFRRANPGFLIREHDAFCPAPVKCDVLRVMNLLTSAYFSTPELKRGAMAAVSSLTDGGLLILGRTAEDGSRQTDATVFRKDPGGLAVVGRLGSGSEIEVLVMTL